MEKILKIKSEYTLKSDYTLREATEIDTLLQKPLTLESIQELLQKIVGVEMDYTELTESTAMGILEDYIAQKKKLMTKFSKSLTDLLKKK